MNSQRLPRMIGRRFLAMAACSGLAWGAGGAVAQTLTIDNAQAALMQNVVIAAPAAGIIQQVGIHEGDRVDTGDLIAQIDDAVVRAELTAALAALDAARLRADNDVDASYARRTMEVHVRELNQSQQANEQFAGAVSGTEIEKLRLVVDQAALSVQQAEQEQAIHRATAAEQQAAATVIRTQVDQHRIVAPAPGTIAEVQVQPGEWVEPGKPIARLIWADPLRVKCFVDGRRYGSELVGRGVVFEVVRESTTAGAASAPTEVIRLVGRVVFVSPEVQPVTGQSELWATVGNPDATVRGGMRGTLTIGPPTDATDDASAVPAAVDRLDVDSFGD